MDKVVQQEASTAEESAAAAEQLNAQAQEMKKHVTQMIALVEGQSDVSAAASQIKKPLEEAWRKARRQIRG